MKYRLGIDLGGTNIAAGVVDENNKIIKKASVRTDASCSDKIASDMAKLALSLLSELSLSPADIERLGAACPGTVDGERGVVEYANNLPLKGFRCAELLSSLTGIGDVRAANDANAAALGEAAAGAGRGASDFVMITLGTGVGGGVIHDGKILAGFNFAGGELGHTVMEVGGEPCTCGRRGCVEAYCSATALIRMTRLELERCRKEGIPTLMEDITAAIGKISGKTAFAAMKQGDAPAKRVTDKYISYLACAVTNYINIFQPEIFAVGGGVCGEGETLLEPLRALVAKEVYNRAQPSGRKTVIGRAELGNDAGIIGACLL